MLKLAPQGKEPVWHEALGARFLFAPITRAMYRRARLAAFAMARDLGERADERERGDAMGDAISESLLTEALLDWEGVGDADGKPIPCTAEHKAMLLDDPARFDVLDALIVLPFSLRVAEGNGLSPSPNGTGAGATPVKDTARSPRAKPRSTGGAKHAPIASTKPARPKRKKSGTS